MNSEPTPPSPYGRDINLDIDGPGDNTIRPCRPERRASLEALREKMRRVTRDGWLDDEGNVHPIDINLDFDGPGDNTIRPCRPERRAALEAEREKLRRWGALQTPPAEEPPAEDSGDNKDSARGEA